MIRNILAVIVGLIVGNVFNMALILLNAYVLFPIPEDMNMANPDPEQLRAYVANMPVAALLVVMVAHLGQAFFGGWTAARLGKSSPVVLAMIIGVLSLIGGIANMINIQGPTWMYIEFPLYLVFAWLAGRIEAGRRARSDQPLTSGS